MNAATIRLMSKLGDLLNDDSPFYTPKKALEAAERALSHEEVY